MKKIIPILILLTTLLSSCFSVNKFIRKHPKRYEAITDTFVARGNCLNTIIKIDTINNIVYKIDTINVTDTFNFVLNGHDTTIIEKRKIIWRDSFKTITINSTVIDSSRIVLLQKQIGAKETILKSQETLLKHYRQLMWSIIIAIMIIIAIKIIFK